jgi:hypothetical protein
MKKKLTMLCLLLLAATLYGQVAMRSGAGKSYPSMNRKPFYHNHPMTPLLEEHFERNPGYDWPGWGEFLGGSGPVVDEDYTSVVLNGSQSLRINHAPDDATYTSNSIPVIGHVWGFFRVRLISVEAANDCDLIRLTAGDGTCQFRVSVISDGGGLLKVWPGCDSPAAAGFPLQIGTTYNLWFEYNKDNGSSVSYASAAFSTDPIKPTSGNQFVEATDAPTAQDVSRIILGGIGSAMDVEFIMDYLVIDDVPIGDYP